MHSHYQTTISCGLHHGIIVGESGRTYMISKCGITLVNELEGIHIVSVSASFGGRSGALSIYGDMYIWVVKLGEVKLFKRVVFPFEEGKEELDIEEYGKDITREDSSLKERIICIAIGGTHILAASNKTLYSWGRNNFFQLGNENTEERENPQRIPFFDGMRIVKVSAGYSTSVALIDDGRVYVWGDNGNERLGIGPKNGIWREPRIATPTMPAFILSSERRHIFGTNEKSLIEVEQYEKLVEYINKLNSGEVEGEEDPYDYLFHLLSSCFSINHSEGGMDDPTLDNLVELKYKLNDGDEDDMEEQRKEYIQKRLDSVLVYYRLIPHIVDIESGWFHMACIDDNGRVWAWGRNTKGCLALGETETMTISVPSLCILPKGVDIPQIDQKITKKTGRGSFPMRVSCWAVTAVVFSSGKLYTAGKTSRDMDFGSNEQKWHKKEGTYFSTTLSKVWFLPGEAYGKGNDDDDDNDDGEEEGDLLKCDDGVFIENVSCGEQFMIAITSDGELYIWGDAVADFSLGWPPPYTKPIPVALGESARTGMRWKAAYRFLWPQLRLLHLGACDLEGCTDTFATLPTELIMKIQSYILYPPHFDKIVQTSFLSSEISQVNSSSDTKRSCNIC